MPIKIRYVSLLLRRWNSRTERDRTLQRFAELREAQGELPAPRPVAATLLIIRLDDIGDYLLFRNQLSLYKQSARWRDHAITLLGNSSWRELFAEFDHGAVDDTIWVNKGEYLTSTPYRMEIWKQLRARGFEAVITPSRTRPLLLDDLCRLAAAPVHSLGCVNTYVHPGWNQISDRLYTQLFQPADTSIHEFHFNGQFSTWICGLRYPRSRPHIDCQIAAAGSAAPLICFVGATTRSRRWPVKRWIQFIKLYRRHHPGRVLLAGSSRAELQSAAVIAAQTDADNIAGKVSLLELLRLVAGSRAVVTNDTMAAHLSVSLGRPTVIVANGVNYQRFTDYAGARMEGVVTIYPPVFNRKRSRNAALIYHYTDALTSDMAAISAVSVHHRLEEALRAGKP